MAYDIKKVIFRFINKDYKKHPDCLRITGLNMVEFERICRKIYNAGNSEEEPVGKRIQKIITDEKSNKKVFVVYAWARKRDKDDEYILVFFTMKKHTDK